jgi:hypothetical protein
MISEAEARVVKLPEEYRWSSHKLYLPVGSKYAYIRLVAIGLEEPM